MANSSHQPPRATVQKITTNALHDAISQNDTNLLYELFVTNARQLAVTGKGQQLIKLAMFAGDNSTDGVYLRRAFAVLGHLVNLEYEVSESLAHELEIEAKDSAVYDFVLKVINYVYAICRFAKGDLQGSKTAIKIALNKERSSGDLDSVDKIQLIRIYCDILVAESNDREILAQFDKAERIANASPVNNFAIHLLAIKAMVLHEQGEYLKAFDLAKSVVATSEANGFSGVHSAIDAKFVMSKCYFAFSKLDQANEILEEIKADALKYGLHPWYVLAEGSIIRNLAGTAKMKESLEKTVELRNFINKFHDPYDFSWLVDISELYLRFKLKDHNRVREISQRLPEFYYVRQVVDAITYVDGKLPNIDEVLKLPESTPRQKIYKSMYLSEYPATTKTSPKKYMKEALRIAQETGSREIFVKQVGSHLNLILNIASEEPSLFLEELTRDCLKRVELENADLLLKNESLTSREIQVLKHLSTGRSIGQIGKELHVSQNTMKTHLRNIYRKLQVDGRKSAVAKAQENFLI
jgi:DNA-binding CsgD family transcriptional regulator/tetratricopeptide (TPR) repeat protein